MLYFFIEESPVFLMESIKIGLSEIRHYDIGKMDSQTYKTLGRVNCYLFSLIWLVHKPF